jgi:hypothetical protein
VIPRAFGPELLLYFYSRVSRAENPLMPHRTNPLSRLDRQELLWLTGILKDACRERLEKNLVSQAFEARLYDRGPVEGRLDPRPFLKIWEPRYRKFLEVATDLHTALEGEDARAAAESLRMRFEPAKAQEMSMGPERVARTARRQ